MKKTALAIIIEKKEEAASGVDFSARTGALCPWCEVKSRIYRTLPWVDTTRIRYHFCDTAGCPLSSLRVSIKSIEADK